MAVGLDNAPKNISRDKGAEVADVRMIVYRWAATVYPNGVCCHGYK
jgi:hypothetical protein